MPVLAPVAEQRILRGAAATLSVQFRDQNGEAAAPGGTVTVDVTKADGTSLVSGGSTSGSSTAPRTYSLSAVATLEMLSAAWKDGGTERATTRVEVVGGFYFSVAEVEAFDTSLGDITDGGTVEARARRVRDETERECERITGAAWVPRYTRVRLDGSGTRTLVLPDGMWNPRVVRSARLYTDATSYTALTVSEVDAIEPATRGVLTRLDGQIWPEGLGNVIVELEHGFDRPPEDLRHAAMMRFRSRWNLEKNSVGAEFAASMQMPGGTRYDVPAGDSTPATMPREVAQTYKQHSVRTPGVA